MYLLLCGQFCISFPTIFHIFQPKFWKLVWDQIRLATIFEGHMYKHVSNFCPSLFCNSTAPKLRWWWCWAESFGIDGSGIQIPCKVCQKADKQGCLMYSVFDTCQTQLDSVTWHCRRLVGCDPAKLQAIELIKLCCSGWLKCFTISSHLSFWAY